MDDLWRLRLRRAGFLLPDPGPASGGAPAFLGKVISTGANLAVGKFFVVNPVDATGAETENGAATLTADATMTVKVYAVGPGVPATGDYVVCRHVQHRWVAEQQTVGGGGTYASPPIPTCICTQVPVALTMVSVDQACNSGMFQSCSIAWGPTPSWAAPLSLGANVFFSTATFPDSVAGGALFYYYLTCAYGEFDLTRVYQTSPYGSPYRDSILYTWLVGGSNTCSPFRLITGSAFSGSDASCSVSITG